MKPIHKPVVNTRLEGLNELQRVVECFHYTILCIEHWISPEGKVREWMRLNTRFAVFMAAPAFLVFPVVTFALWEVEAWVNALTTIVSKLVFLPILVLLVLVSIMVAFQLVRMFKP